MTGSVWIWLLVLDVFVALTAIGGGIALAIGLEGDRFPLEWLDGTLFRSYVMPGLILSVVVGGSAAIAAVMMIGDRSLGGGASMIAGAMLVGFIVVELVVLNDQARWTRTEIFYLAVGLLMAVLGLTYLA
ncbi:MAG: hypothetical protein R2849_15890 [Thermomicrobiales bacterium]